VWTVLFNRQLFLFLNIFFLALSLSLLCLFRKMLSVFILSSFMLPPCLSSCLLPLLFFSLFYITLHLILPALSFLFSPLFPRHLNFVIFCVSVYCLCFICSVLCSLLCFVSSFRILLGFLLSVECLFFSFCRTAPYLVPITKFCVTLFTILTALFAE
jgi:hypothetical protein